MHREKYGHAHRYPQTGLPEGKAAAAYEALAADSRVSADIDSICEELKNANVWVWRKGAIESHLGISSKNSKAWAGLLDQIEKNGIDSSTKDAAALKNCIAWCTT